MKARLLLISEKSAVLVRSLFKMSSVGVIKELFSAIDMGDSQKVEAMLKNKQATVHTRNPDDKNNTPLHAAAYEGKFKLVKYLVDTHQADVNSKNDEGKIPLEGAVDKYHGSIARFLIKRNSDKKEYADKLRNPPNIEELIEAAENGDLDTVKNILDSGKADVEAVDKWDNNRTLLHIAAKYGYLDLAKMLVESYEADKEVTDDIGDTPVDTAVAFESDDVADYLMDSDDDDDEVDTAQNKSVEVTETV